MADEPPDHMPSETSAMRYRRAIRQLRIDRGDSPWAPITHPLSEEESAQRIESLMGPDAPHNPHAPAKLTIVSGGQTGADRAALDAALAAGAPCGGWCPKGRVSEDGPIPARYPLKESAGGYLHRTERNVIDSDGTVIFTPGDATGGSLQTARFCGMHRRPFLHIDTNEVTTVAAVEMVRRFIREANVQRLNVAGSRASKAPSLYAFVRAVIEQLIRADTVDRSDGVGGAT